ncbi:MAG TPA: hypothetical protein VFV81_02250 [Verrucomicrobiae bacterium]|nr:hypothetical protein [Verrucomicrobiae bacterium]
MKRSLCLLPLIIVVWGLDLHPLPARSQVLANGGFESGLADWSLQTTGDGSARLDTIRGMVHSGKCALKISVADAGTSSNSVQLIHRAFTADGTNTYVLRFWASSEVNFADLSVTLAGASPAFPQIPFRISTNENGYQEYLYPFRASGRVAVTFNFQTSSNIYYLDDVEVLDANHSDGWDLPMTYLWRWGQLDYARTNPVGWVAGDNDKSVLLPDGSVLWLFNDSWTERLNFYSNVPGGGGFPRNCAVHQVGTNLYTLSNSTFFPATNPANLFWIGDAVMESNQVNVLLAEVDATAIRRVGTAVGTVSWPSLRVERITPIRVVGADDYNQVLDGHDGFYYIYWTTNLSNNPFFAPTNRVHVARVPVGSLSNDSAWRFWNGAVWQTNHLQVAPVPGLVSPASFTQLGPGNFACVYLPPLSLTIRAQFARSPMGPWTKPVPVFEIEGEWGEYYYMPNLCAGTGADGIYTIGYSDNGAPDNLAKIANDRSYYDPHFVRVNLRQLSPFTLDRPRSQ